MNIRQSKNDRLCFDISVLNNTNKKNKDKLKAMVSYVNNSLHSSPLKRNLRKIIHRLCNRRCKGRSLERNIL